MISAGVLLALQSQEIKLALLFPPPFNRTYYIHRVWKSQPKKTNNGDQIHDLTVRLGAVPYGRNHICKISFLAFSGKDFDFGETAHLAKMAPEIKKLELVRLSDPQGGIGEWGPVGFNSAGWAGMMAEKAVGRFEVGFLDIHYPVKSVRVGEEWTAHVLLGNESTDGEIIKEVKGTKAICTYKLEAIDPVRRAARISFTCHTIITGTYQPIFPKSRAAPIWYSESESGEWTVDALTGLPITFQAERDVTVRDAGQRSTESTSTTVHA